jgi:magnesium transporter
MIRSFVFSQKQGRLVSQDLPLDLLRVVLADEGVQFWVDAGECTDEEAKSLLEGVFNFHPLAVEDCLTVSERPKIDEYDGYVFVVIHAVNYVPASRTFTTTELNLFIGPNFLVTYHREPLRCVGATIDRILKNAPTVARAPDRLTYTLLDYLLENYAPALEELSMEIANLERNVMAEPTQDFLGDVIELKSEVQRLRQIVWPQREIVTRMAHGQFKIVRAAMLPYYRDLLDQLVRITDLTENYRDSLTGVLQIHLNLQQSRVNQVIKVLTVMAALATPLLIVTSFYGMNFRHMPELEWHYAHIWWVLGLGAACAAALYMFLRRKGWW